MPLRWYHRLADIAGVEYTGSPEVRRSHLPYHQLEPELQYYIIDGQVQESLRWTYRDYASSSSPASQWNAQLPADSFPQQVLQHLAEVLELPGEATDYHFAIQGCCTQLWRYRYDYPWVLAEVERLCWLDIRLFEVLPTMLRVEQDDGTWTYARISAFDWLIRLYERNGYLTEALVVAQRITHFYADDSVLKRLQARLARLAEEL